MKKNKLENLIYSVLGVIILLVIIIAINSLTSAVNQQIDLTRDKAYTLSDGTRAILQKLDTPVKIRFYYSAESGSGNTILLKSYAQHVADLLEEYKKAGKGKIIIEQYDPKPDSDAEDSARLDGVEGQPLPTGEKFYLGLSVSLLDSKEAIPFLDPNRERLLEYDLSRAISRVATPDKPVIGIMTSLPVFGRPNIPMMGQMGQSGQDPWIFVQELKSDYNVKPVPLTATNIDQEVKLLIVLHPLDISDQAQYAIDQFIMRGGKVIAFLDALSLVESRNQNSMMGQMPGGGSTLDKLLKAWGIEFDPTKVAVDMNYKVKILGQDNQPADAPAFLALEPGGINTNDVATSQLQSIWYAMGGAFTGRPVAGLTEVVLLKTTKDSELTDAMRAGMAGESVIKDFKPSGIEYALGIRLTGKFKTAFPEGRPQETKEGDKSAVAKEPSLKETQGEGAVVLFGDADMMSDQFVMRPRQTPFGPIGYELANGNIALIQNLADQLSGDNNLIRIRSRAAIDRPFVRIKEIEAKAQESYQSKVNEFEESLRETQQKVNELQQTKGQGQQRFILSPEQQAELDKLKKKEAEVNVQLKLEKKKLTRDISSLENNLKWANIIGMPAMVALAGIALAIFKRNRTAAK